MQKQEKKLKLFFDKIEVDINGCWLWKAALNSDGYGQFRGFDSRNTVAHKFSYQYFKDKIKKGLVLDHLCRVRKCANPNHVEPVTDKINVLRGEGLAAINHLKTHCKRGHAFDEKNTDHDHRGDRYCKAWNRERMRIMRKRKNEQRVFY